MLTLKFLRSESTLFTDKVEVRSEGILVLFVGRGYKSFPLIYICLNYVFHSIPKLHSTYHNIINAFIVQGIK